MGDSATAPIRQTIGRITTAAHRRPGAVEITERGGQTKKKNHEKKRDAKQSRPTDNFGPSLFDSVLSLSGRRSMFEGNDVQEMSPGLFFFTLRNWRRRRGWESSHRGPV